MRTTPSLAATTLLTSLLWAAAPAHAQPTKATDLDKKASSVDPKALLKELESIGKRYGDARRLLARGKPDQALAALKRPGSALLADREALLRGDALLALGQKTAARDAYLGAHDQAKNEDVKLRASRGLANVYGQLGDREKQLEVLEELLAVRNISRRPSLMLERASVLARLGRNKDAAEAAWRVVLDYPSGTVSEEAQALLERLGKKGVTVPASSHRLELVRIQNMTRSGEFTRAEKALADLKKRAPELAHSIALEQAQIYKRQRNRQEEVKILTALHKDPTLDRTLQIEVLDRLGRAAMSTNDDPQAIKWFDELAKKFPRSSKAAEAQYLAAWLPYNAGQYDVAASRFLDFTQQYRRWRRRPEALWFAGWSAYLGKNDALARRAFAQLLDEHPSSDMGLWAHYWTGRIRERAGDEEGARTSYRNVLRIAPLGYMSNWAASRLEKLGEKVVIEAPDGDKPATLEQVLVMLGDQRPEGVDRGIALHRGGVELEALEELEDVSKALAKIRDTRGMVMVAEMLHGLGAHHQAFRMASRITSGGADLITGEPYAWRAWRLAYPKAFWEEVEAAAKAHDVDPLLVLSIMRTESHFRPHVRSPVGARGLMQIMPATAKRIGKVAEGGRVHAARYGNPQSNIWLGAWYLRQLLDRYGGQIALAAGAYNAGPGAMDRWVAAGANMELDAFIETVSYRETRMYMRRVLETHQIYRRLDAHPHSDLAWVVQPDLPNVESVSF